MAAQPFTGICKNFFLLLMQAPLTPSCLFDFLNEGQLRCAQSALSPMRGLPNEGGRVLNLDN